MPCVPILDIEFLGKYRLLSPIRTGRFTQIWSAMDDVQQRYAAIKLLLPEFRRDREQIRVMQHELAVGRKLNHPRCLGAQEFRHSKDGPHLLMDLFPGENLRDLMKRNRATLLAALPSIIRQTVEGIAYLNSLGLLHLDVKPDNFIINAAGEVKLIDFALARALPNAWERLFWQQRNRAIQGTRTYLSPEQIRRLPVDLRTDVYSFGCMLFHLAAGVPPFTGLSSNELLAKHVQAKPPNLSIENEDATPEFVDLVRRMMAKRPDDRPTSLGEILPTLATMTFLQSQKSATTVHLNPEATQRGLITATKPGN